MTRTHVGSHWSTQPHRMQRDVGNEDFKAHFGEYGPMEDAVVVMDQNNVSRGFGFVTYEQQISVEKALIVKHVFSDRVVDCKRAVPKDQVCDDA